MGKRTLKDYDRVSVKPEELDGAIDFELIFGRPGPVHIEIGTGKGTFLLAEARAAPEVNFLGIEWANKYYRYAVDRIGRWGLANVRIIRTDAAFFLPEHVPDSSIDCFCVYFPDPWPKKRHNKRRFISTANMAQMLRCLKTGGIIQIATDHADYFEQIEEVVKANSGVLETIDFTPAAGARDGELTGTNYERKYIKDKREIYTTAVKKS
ncbi:MAG: tRNA (guanosine(46)-N7)-methyltransferase TrmB [Planctomycetota bacterium]|jgi:tRNA (guanine-N7-)-methyltransferase